MQSEKTLSFWNDFYTKEQTENTGSSRGAREWILQPSTPLLDAICCHLPQADADVLEIGCGSSNLSLKLWQHFQREPDKRCRIVATDVSSVCIEQNEARDEEIILDSKAGFRYQVLNVLEPKDFLERDYDVILDKGCLDTFLFRSRERGPKARIASPLLQTVLDNIHRLLRKDGKYIILTPRRNITAVRGYVGFSSVSRSTLDQSKVMLGDLDGSAVSEEAFMHVCVKNSHYKVGTDKAFLDKSHGLVQQHCPSCGLTFDEFYRSSEDKKNRDEAYWLRRWKGHCSHCKNEPS